MCWNIWCGDGGSRLIKSPTCLRSEHVRLHQVSVPALFLCSTASTSIFPEHLYISGGFDTSCFVSVILSFVLVGLLSPPAFRQGLVS